MLSEPEHPVSRMEFKFLSNSRGVIREFDSGTPPEGATGGIITKNKSRPLVECNATLVHVCIYIYIYTCLPVLHPSKCLFYSSKRSSLSLFDSLPAASWMWRRKLGVKGRGEEGKETLLPLNFSPLDINGHVFRIEAFPFLRVYLEKIGSRFNGISL